MMRSIKNRNKFILNKKYQIDTKKFYKRIKNVILINYNKSIKIYQPLKKY